MMAEIIYTQQATTLDLQISPTCGLAAMPLMSSNPEDKWHFLQCPHPE